MSADIPLKGEWERLTDASDAGHETSEAVFADLCRRYSEPSRFYHTLTHVAQMLKTVDRWRQALKIRDVNAVRLAVWFHDAVYDSRASDNEAQSARLMREALLPWGIPEETLVVIERLILATKTHRVAEDDWDGALLLDADLAILGSGSGDYAIYSRAIRDEFAWVSEADYRTGRSRVLQTFLERSRIYRTPMGLDVWEESARRNIAGEIAQLHG